MTEVMPAPWLCIATPQSRWRYMLRLYGPRVAEINARSCEKQQTESQLPPQVTVPAEARGRRTFPWTSHQRSLHRPQINRYLPRTQGHARLHVEVYNIASIPKAMMPHPGSLSRLRLSAEQSLRVQTKDESQARASGCTEEGRACLDSVLSSRQDGHRLCAGSGRQARG